MLKDNISLPSSPLATTLLCELLISVRDQIRVKPSETQVLVVHCPRSVDSLLIPGRSLAFTTTWNSIWITSRISTDELFQTLSYRKGKSWLRVISFKVEKVLIRVQIKISITGWKWTKIKPILYEYRLRKIRIWKEMKLYIFDELTSSFVRIYPFPAPKRMGHLGHLNILFKTGWLNMTPSVFHRSKIIAEIN